MPGFIFKTKKRKRKRRWWLPLKKWFPQREEVKGSKRSWIKVKCPSSLFPLESSFYGIRWLTGGGCNSSDKFRSSQFSWSQRNKWTGIQISRHTQNSGVYNVYLETFKRTPGVSFVKTILCSNFQESIVNKGKSISPNKKKETDTTTFCHQTVTVTLTKEDMKLQRKVNCLLHCYCWQISSSGYPWTFLAKKEEKQKEFPHKLPVSITG